MNGYHFVNTTDRFNTPLFDIRYCTRCCMPETEEGYTDDEHGMCRICRSSEQKMHINWIERRAMLERILDQCRKNAGNSYDCIVPISGGKDSTFQLHILTKVFDMKPLAVTYNHNWYSKTGWYNLLNALINFDVDHIIFTPNRNLIGRIARRSLEMIGDACWSCHSGVGAFPLHVAAKYNIPVIIYGESDAEDTQRGEYNQLMEYDKNYYTRLSAKKTPDEMAGKDLTRKDLFMYQLPSDKEYANAHIKILHLGDYIFWDDERQMEYIRDTYSWKETEIENAYKGYKSAECIMPGIHDFTCYLKRGWARAAYHASLDVRNGILTRDEGFRLINCIDPQRPEVMDYYLKITGMTEKEFYDIMKRHLEPALKNKQIPILPKKRKNREKLIPFAEQLIKKYRPAGIANKIQLKPLCFTCGLELKSVKSDCPHCSNRQASRGIPATSVESLKEYFNKIKKSSGDNYDCIVPLDDSWQSAYLLHLITKIYNLKALAVTFNKHLYSEIGWYNVVNCLESFYVDHLMFTPRTTLAKKLRTASIKSQNYPRYLSDAGLYSFIAKTACKFNISTIIGFHVQLGRFTKKATERDLKFARIDFHRLMDIENEMVNNDITNRDIYLFCSEFVNRNSIDNLVVIDATDYFPFNKQACSFVKKYYGWKEDSGNNQKLFIETFLANNKPKLLPPYWMNPRIRTIRKKVIFTSDLTQLSARSIVQGYINKDFSPVDVAKSVIKKIRKIENKINAWEVFDDEKYLSQAKECENKIQKEGVSKILQGIPVGIKDIFNTAEFPTQMGSALWKGFTPGNDARAVFNIKRAGGIICGKTVTSEFAVHALNKTLNPHHKNRTPGTSSSGSAAAIATRMVPVALGTQSGASIIRPASFCGVYGFKPSFGLIPRTGILKTTDTLDNVGFFVHHAEDIETAFNSVIIHGSNYPMNNHGMNYCRKRIADRKKTWKIAFVKTHTWAYAEEYAKAALLQWINKTGSFSDFDIIETSLPAEMDKAHDLHSNIYDYCLAYYFSKEFRSREDLSERLQGQIEHGKSITPAEYQKALNEQMVLWQTMDAFMNKYDAMISLSTAGEAPVRGEVEQPDPGLMWTMSNLPALNVPAFISPGGLPFGLQIIARRYYDLLIMAIVKTLASYRIIPSGNHPEINAS